MSATLPPMSEDDKKARLWLLKHLDLAGKGSSSPQPSRTLEGLDLAGQGAPDTPSVKKTVQDNKALGKLADQLLKALTLLKLPEKATSRQIRLLATETDAIRQSVRDEKLNQAQEGLKEAVQMHKVLTQQINERLLREERHARLPPLADLLAGQQKRLTQSDETYKTAEAAERVDEARNALQDRERLQETLAREVKERLARQSRHVKLPALGDLSAGQQKRRDQSDKIYETAEAEERIDDAENALKTREDLQETLLEELALAAEARKTLQDEQIPEEANDEERRQLQTMRDDIGLHLKEDRFQQAVETGRALTQEVKTVKQTIAKAKSDAKAQVQKLQELVSTLVNNLVDGLTKGMASLSKKGAKFALSNHPAAKILTDKKNIIAANMGDTAKRAEADEFLLNYGLMATGLTTASEALASSLEDDLAAMSLITKTLERCQEYLNKTKDTIKFVPSAWGAWPKTLPKPKLEELKKEPKRDTLLSDREKASTALENAKNKWESEPGSPWDEMSTDAQNLLNACKEAWKGYYKVVSEHVYTLLEDRKQTYIQSLKDDERTFTTYFDEMTKKEKERNLPSLNEEQKKKLTTINNAVEQSGKGKKGKKTDQRTELANLIKGLGEELTSDMKEAESKRKGDGVSPQEVKLDPTSFKGHKDYILTASKLQNKPVYARLDSSVTSDKHFDDAYGDALAKGIIASTTTGQAGIKKEPYGWVVKVTLATANAVQGVDNVWSPLASDGIKLSDTDEPAFYLNFDKWVSRH